MLVPSFTKYGFRIRTCAGLEVGRLMIHGRDEADAERKLKQMYHDCEIIERTRHEGRKPLSSTPRDLRQDCLKQEARPRSQAANPVAAAKSAASNSPVHAFLRSAEPLAD